MWVRLIAERRGTTAAAVMREVRTTRALTPEIADLIHERALLLARRTFADEDAPLIEGDDLLSVIARRYYARWDADRQVADALGQEMTAQMVLAYQRQAGITP